MFDRYGNVPNLPEEIWEAKNRYFNVIEKHLNKMPIVEVKAFLLYINMEAEIAGYILRRQAALRRENEKH